MEVRLVQQLRWAEGREKAGNQDQAMSVRHGTITKIANWPADAEK
jgi:hypothetical protein